MSPYQNIRTTFLCVLQKVKLYIPTKLLKYPLSKFNFHSYKHSEVSLRVNRISGTVISYFSITIIKDSDQSDL